MCVVCVCVWWAWVSSDTYGGLREHLSTSGICMRFWQSGREFLGHFKVLRIWRKYSKEELQPSEISPGYQNHSFTLCQTRHGIILSVRYSVFNILLSYMHVLKENPHNTILFSLWRKQKRFRNRGRTHCIPEGPIKILQTSFLLLPKSIQFTSLGATCCYLLLQLIYYT